MTTRTSLLAVAMLAGLQGNAIAQSTSTPPAIVRTVNRTQTVAQENGRAIIRLDAKANDGFAIVQGPAFSEGTIDLLVRGEDVAQQSFVGVAWNIQNDSTYEAVYLRPFNFRTPDSAR